MADERRGRFGWVRRLIRPKTVSGTGIIHHNEENNDNRNYNIEYNSTNNHNEPSYNAQRDSYRVGQHHQSASQATQATLGTQGTDEYPGSDVSQTSDNLSASSPSESRPSRVQIIDSRPSQQQKSDTESLFSSTHDSGSKRHSNSNFTVPSVSRTSITTVSPSISETTSIHTIPSSLATPITSTVLDTASVITIASSSKHHHRSSFDTNASTRAIAPDSILMKDEDDMSVADLRA